MPTLLSPFENDASGNQHDTSSPENDQTNDCRPPNLSPIKRRVERNENEKKNANLSNVSPISSKRWRRQSPLSNILDAFGHS
jgi:hypothetical protein